MEKLLIYFLSLILVVISGCSDSKEWYAKTPKHINSLPDRLLAEADMYYQGSSAFQNLLTEALVYDTTNAGVWRETAVPYLKRGLAAQSDMYFNQAVKHDPVSWLGYRGYNYLYFYRDFDRALRDFDRLDKLTPGFVDYPQGQSIDYMRGIAHYGAERYDSAMHYLNRYITAEGERWADANTYIYLGLAFEKKGNLQKALETFDLLIKYNPKSADGYFHKARVHLSQGDNAEASSNITTAHEYYRKGYFHQRSYVEVLEQIYEEDILEIKESLSISPKKL